MKMLSAGRNGTAGIIKETEAVLWGCTPRTTKEATVMKAYNVVKQIVMGSVLLARSAIQILSETHSADIESIIMVTVTIAMVLVNSVALALRAFVTSSRGLVWSLSLRLENENRSHECVLSAPWSS